MTSIHSGKMYNRYLRSLELKLYVYLGTHAECFAIESVKKCGFKTFEAL